MLIDLNHADTNFTVSTDVCVVGGGAAGISLTRQLVRDGHQVCLLESGGMDFEANTQSLYAGTNIGMPYYDLIDARLRFLGGTTNIWGGRCTPLDPIDFAQRSWVAHSGWPISMDTLRPHYHAAHEALGLGEYRYDKSLWEQLGEAPPFSSEYISTRFWRFDTTKERFNASRCQDLFNNDNVTVVIHANVVQLQANPGASALEHIVTSTLDGRRFNFRARFYILATGGIENARLLLASNNVESEGIGNRHDLVGRYFMEHQHGRAGRIKTDAPYRLWSLFRKRKLRNSPPIAPTIVASSALQERDGLLNSAFTFKLQRPPEHGLLLNDRIYRALKHQLPPDRVRRRMWHVYRDVRGLIQRHIKPLIEPLRARANTRKLYLMVRAEQAPNPDSRVQLSKEVDALGMPKVNLDWRLSSQDKDTVAGVCKQLDVEFQHLGKGRIEPSQWLADPAPEWPVDPTVSKHPIGGYHHMGTTRMSDSPSQGVVDANCRVHDYANLYIAGSSVFPTGGWANPTLTILALTDRLAEHLNEKLATVS